MAGNTKVPDKKTLVAIIIIAVLVIVAIVGTVVFLKNRGTTEATDLSSYNEQSTGTTQEEQETTNTQEQSGEPATQSAEEQATETTEPTEETETADTDTTTVGGNQGAAGTGATGGVAGTTTTTDNIQETIISREETVVYPDQLVAKGEDKIWTPRELQASFANAYSNIEGVQTPDITVTKTATTQSGSTLVQVGETITYTITVQNNTDEKIERIYVTDAIPEGTTYVSSMGDVETFADTEGNVTSLRWLVDVDANATATVEFTVEVNDDATGIISNVAIANGEESNEGKPIEHSVITVAKANTLESDTVKPEDTFDYTITIKNTGNIAGTVEVTDEVPGQLEVTGTNPEATVTGNNVNFGEVTVPAEGTVTLTISVKVKAEATGTISNTAIVNGEEVKDPEDIHTVNITGVKANTLEGNIVKPGDEFAYTITLTNSGNTVGTVPVTDELPGQLEITGTNPTGTVTGNNVDFGNVTVEPETPVTLTIHVKVKAEATGDINNTAIVDGEEVEDPETIKTVNITGVKANTLESETVKPGDEFAYTITLTNSGNTAGTVPVTDEVPGQLEVTGTNPTATVNGNNVDFGDITVEPGTPVTLTIHVKVKADATGTISNTAIVNGEEVKDPEDIHTVNITGVKANTLESETVKPGDEFAYTITLTNSGNTAGTVPVTDEVPGQLEITGTNPTATVNGNNVDFGDITVEPGTPVTLTIQVKVKADATGTIKNVAKVNGEDTPDEEITIENVPKITGVKTNEDPDKVVKPGDEVTYTIKLSNSGNVEGTTTITDKLPDGVIYKDSSDDGIYNSNTKTVIWNDVKVPVGMNTKILTVTVTIDKSATKEIINTAYIGNEEKHDEGLDLVKITAEKVSDVTTIATVGQEVTYTITAVNNGTIKGDAVITDQIPSELEYKNATLTNVDGDTISVENGIVSWNVKDLEPGEDNARTLTITATVKDFEGKSETITNEVKVDGEKTSETTIEAGKPVITSTKTSEIISCERNELDGTTVHEGDKIKYTITVKNDGTVEKQINITDQIKEGLSYVDGTLKASFAGTEISSAKVENGVVKLENYTLTIGGTLTIEFTVQVNTLPEGVSSKVIDKNIAVIDDNNKEDEKGDYEVVKPIITTEKSSSIVSCSKDQTTGTIVHEGDQIQYEIKVTNSGETSGKVTVEDTIKSGLTYVQGTVEATVDGSAISGIAVNNGKVMLSDYTLEAHKTLIIKFTVQVDSLPEGVYGKTINANVVTVNGETTTDTTGEYDVVKPHITASKSSTIVECSLGQTTGTKLHEGDTIRYTITVENDGTESDIINVTDEIPDDVTYVDNSLVATLNDGTSVEEVTVNNRVVSLTAYELVGGRTLTITFDVTVDALEEGTYSNQIANNIAIVNGANTPDKGGYNVEKPQIESSKVVDKPQAEYGDILTYTITAKNLSNITAPVNINDPIPEGTEYVQNSITVNGRSVSDDTYYVDGNVVYTGELTKQDETLTITFQVRVTEKSIGKDITNIATINSEEKQAITKVVKQVTVGTESTKVNPIDLVLVLDTSSSMNDYNRLTNLKSAAKDLANKVFADETESTISIVTYSSSASNNGTYNYNQRRQLENTINGLRAPAEGAGTNIYAALNTTTSLVNGLTSDRETIVVFLTDGSPTIPSSEYIDGIYTDTNSSSGYNNNVKDSIEQKAAELQAIDRVREVYSIGLSVNSLSDSIISYAEECTVPEIGVNTDYKTNDHTFTITLTNPTNSQITLEEVTARISNIDEITSVSDNGTISRGNNVTWRNLTIEANGTITLTGNYEPDYGYDWGGRYEKAPSINNVNTSFEGACTDPTHQVLFNGEPLYSEIKTTRNGRQYHCITQKDYANYLLAKISTDGTSMNVDNVSTAFDKILQDISTTSNVYTVEDGTVIEVPETRTIISDVTVKIGETSNVYTLNELRNGVNGLVYKDGTGFEWTITGDTLLTNKLSLEYKVDE